MNSDKSKSATRYFCDDETCSESILIPAAFRLGDYGWYSRHSDSLVNNTVVLCHKHNPMLIDTMSTKSLTFSQEKKSLKEFASDLGLDLNETPGKRVIKRK